MGNNLIKKLREAKTLADADPILSQLRASTTQRKLVEASILQRMNPNPASYEYGVSMLNAVIRELDPDEEPASPESPGLKRKGDHFVKEEEGRLDNHNDSDHNNGSHQSTDNTEPYKGEGDKDGDEDMLNAPDTENQMSETDDDDNDREREAGEPPFPKNLEREMGGMHPDIAKSMGAQMPKIPPMGTADQMKQMKYTVRKVTEALMREYIMPMQRHSKIQDKAIKKLNQKIRETEARAGSYSLDMHDIKRNSPVRVRETVQSNTIPAGISSPQEAIAYAQANNKKFDLQNARNEILQMNNDMSQ